VFLRERRGQLSVSWLVQHLCGGSTPGRVEGLPGPFAGHREILAVDLEPDEFACATLRRRDGRIAKPEKRVHDHRRRLSVKLDALAVSSGGKVAGCGLSVPRL
jgi:hypothetical protein